MNCKTQYKIDSWVCGTKIVYTPCHKGSLFFIPIWIDMGSSFGSWFFDNRVRYFVDSEEEARRIIDKHKSETVQNEAFRVECRATKKEFGKNRTICVD